MTGRVPRHRGVLAAGVLLVLLGTGALATGDAVRSAVLVDGAGQRYGPGAPGIGDPYFPEAGNGGYDVDHYDLRIRFDPGTGRLDGTAVLTATATENLSRLNLDFDALNVSALSVGGRPARWSRDGDRELIITPRAGLRRGARFAVEVRYFGVPGTGNGSSGPATEGFLRNSAARSAVVVGEPDSAAHWFPVNDHPRDKATYDFAITVPDGLTAVANGVPGGESSAGGWTTWRWREAAPMASYLATMAVGRFRLVSTVHSGLPVVTAVAASLPPERADAAIARTPEIVDFLAGAFGPYPFDAMGGIVPDEGRLRFALETQTRPVYSQHFFDSGTVDEKTVVIAHELAHQWYGDSVSLSAWRDIWLNEGFATYGQWLWTEHLGRRTVTESFDDAYRGADDKVWLTPPAAPGVSKLFGASVYQRGAMALQALRVTVGDGAFFSTLREWAARKRWGNATTEEFVALAERVSGRPVRALLTAWLYTAARPAYPGA
jgi:aminopeptidase N